LLQATNAARSETIANLESGRLKLCFT